MDKARDFKEEVREKLGALSLRLLSQPHKGEAAVLMAIFELAGEPHFLLTKRTENVRTHKGQISFPGGLRQPHDASLRDTALRETEEEVGVPSSCVEVLGRYHQYLAITEQVVTPFVGYLNEGFPLALNQREVEFVLKVPLDFFRRTAPAVEYRERQGVRVPVYFYDYQGKVIWGLTAAIIRDFVEFIGTT